MSDTPISNNSGPIPNGIQTGSASPAGTKPIREGADTHSGGPAFKALLDRLEQKAESLRLSAETIQGPEKLAGAMDDARASLEDALSLGDQLLESFRKAQQDASAPEFKKEDK